MRLGYLNIILYSSLVILVSSTCKKDKGILPIEEPKKDLGFDISYTFVDSTHDSTMVFVDMDAYTYKKAVDSSNIFYMAYEDSIYSINAGHQLTPKVLKDTIYHRTYSNQIVGSKAFLKVRVVLGARYPPAVTKAWWIEMPAIKVVNNLEEGKIKFTWPTDTNTWIITQRYP